MKSIPKRIVTDKLGSYGAALKLLDLKHLQDVGGGKNNPLNVLTFLSDVENEKLRNSGRSIKPRNSCQHTVKSTISLIIDAISSQDQHSENLGTKLNLSGVLRPYQFAHNSSTDGTLYLA